MKKVLIADPLPPHCTQMLREAGLEVVDRPGLKENELKAAVRGVSGIICRSGAQITEAVLEAADKLEAVCRAGVGVDNVDVPAASRKGVVVMNTPGANTLSTAEHAFALLLALARNVAPAYMAMRQGRWEKKGLIGSQLAGSALGVVGLGRIGQAVAKRAVAFDMNVLVYDPYVSRETAEKIGATLMDDLEALLARADYVTVHVPENEQTAGLIDAGRIAQMKEGARLINCARGAVVDMEAAVAAVRAGKLAGAAFDVFVKEPPDSFEFAQHDRILATPHLGASTEAAQIAVAVDAAEQMADALTRRHFRNAVNMAAVPPEEMKALQPYCDLAMQLGKLVAQMNRGHPEAIEIACKGDLAQSDTGLVVSHGVMGVLQPMFGSHVNVVSAPHLAEERGVRITASSTVGLEAGFTDLVVVKLVTDVGSVEAEGTVFGRKHPRIVRIGDFYVEVIPEGDLLIVRGSDVPGLIGKVGAILGVAGVNIARMAFGRTAQGGDAILALNLDSGVDAKALEKIRELDVVQDAAPVRL
jgi:D-3-phosphoglycerate dehydrogenase